MSGEKCNTPLKSCMGLCERYGDAMYGGRCWQHRPITDADRQAARGKRVAKHDAEERYFAAKDRERRARSAFEIARDELVADLIEGRENRPSRERIRQLRTLRDDWNRAHGAARALALVPE